MLRNKLFVTMLMLATLMFSVVACGSDDETEVTEVIKEVQVPGETVIVEKVIDGETVYVEVDKELELSGTIEIDGSSTVFPISVAAAELFREIHPDVQIPVGISGTGGGMKRFGVGETAISNASRPMKDKEAAVAAENGIEFTELTVAFDGLSVVVNKSNDWVECLTTEELKLIWDEGSTVNNWNQVRSSFPDVEMNLYGPGTDSGTFDYFTDEINGDEGRTRADYTPSEDDNVLVMGVAGDKGSMGYFGYAYYVENKDKIKVVEIDGGTGCIAPSEATINDSSYSPLSRPLFIYVNNGELARPEVYEFVKFYLENGSMLAGEGGYVGLPQSMYDDGLAAIAPKYGKQEAALELSGTIEIDGSSTVFPISVAAAEIFRETYPDVQIPVGISGTGGGMKRFGVGETAISNASRPMKDKEAAVAAENGIEFTELTVAFDGLSVVVNKSNDWVECLTTEELKLIWDEGSTVNNWNQVRSSFPDVEMNLYGPGTDSGTFDYFTDEINGDEGRTRADYTPSEDDNVLVMGVAGDKGSMGYFGYAYYVENKDKIKVVEIDGGTGCIAPSEATINDSSYSPLSRPLFIYVNNGELARPEVYEFVKFYLENGSMLAGEGGYVGLPQSMYDDGLAAIAPKYGKQEAALELSGTIEIDGSSTVFPISVAAAEIFRETYPDVQIPVGISGTGGGMKRFGVGETAISNASRPMKDKEAAVAAENGVEFTELTVAFDGLSVVVNKSNDWVECLTTEELKLIWDQGSTVNNWNQVRSSFPDVEMNLYGPGTDSGTFDYFTDEINGDEGRTRSDYTPSEDDNVLVMGVAGDKGSMGYFGYAYYVENKDKIKVVEIDGGTGCIAPSEATINDSSYSPLSRPLFIYVNNGELARPEVYEFVKFYLEEGPMLAGEGGYVSLPQSMYDDGLAAIAKYK